MKVWVAVPMQDNYCFHTEKDCHAISNSEVVEKDRDNLLNKRLCRYCSGEKEHPETQSASLRDKLSMGDVEYHTD